MGTVSTELFSKKMAPIKCSNYLKENVKFFLALSRETIRPHGTVFEIQ